MIYLETGAIDIGYGRLIECPHCGNSQREIIKREFSNMSLFVPIGMINQRGKVLCLCYICNWGIKMDVRKDLDSIAKIVWDGRFYTKRWLDGVTRGQRRRIIIEYRKLGIPQMVSFLES